MNEWLVINQKTYLQIQVATKKHRSIDTLYVFDLCVGINNPLAPDTNQISG